MAKEAVTLSRAQAQVLLLVSLRPQTVSQIEAGYFARCTKERKCKTTLDELAALGFVGCQEASGRNGWTYWLTSAADDALDAAYALLSAETGTAKT